MKYKHPISFRCVLFLCILSFLLCLTACKRTPTEQAVTEKDSEELNELLQQKGNAKPTAQQEAEVSEAENIWNYTKEYESGAQLIVEASLTTHEEANAPVATIVEKPFTEEQCEKISEAIFPNHQIYNYEITKEILEGEIMEYKEFLHKAKTDPDYFFFEDGDRRISFALPEGTNLSVQEMENLTVEEELNIILDDLEKRYLHAPTEVDLKTTDFQFKSLSESQQLNLMTRDNKKTILFDFVNWTSGIRGSEFLFSMNGENLGNDKILNECVAPDSLKGNDGFENAKKIADRFAQNLGADYMEIEWVTTGTDINGEEFYTLCYTRTVNDFRETHTSDYLGTLAFDPDFDQFQDLWKYESLEITTKGNFVISARWLNPGEITIENENVKMISWEEAQDVFLKQMDRLMSPETSEDDFQLGILGGDREIHINKIELGLTKILMAESGEYKLIPTWNFSGYDKSHLFNDPETAGAITCFVTINAVDGSIIDRGLMY